MVIGAGKASAAMAQAVEQVIGDHIDHGVVVVKYGHGAALSKVQLLKAGHPAPDAAGEIAARAIEDALRGLTADDLAIVC